MITIRFATSEDIPQLLVLLETLFSVEVDFTIDPIKQAKGLALLLLSVKDGVWVAELNGTSKIVGLCSIQTMISTAEGGFVGLLEDLVVMSDYRQHGIGAKLLAEAINWSKAQGLKRLQLLADKNNVDALAFYQKQGWLTTQLICLRAADLLH